MKIRGVWRIRHIARRFTNLIVPPAIILLYHRVVDLRADPQLLCVTPKHFAEHLEILRKWCRPTPLKKLGDSSPKENRLRREVVVTFDDGYRDNLINAKPLLERYDVPATVFVTTGYLGSNREFWYDDLERIFLHPRPLPERLRLKVNERCYEWRLDSEIGWSEEAYRSFSEWNVLQKDNPTVRHSLYRSLFEILHPLPDGDRQKILEKLARWAGTDTLHRQTHCTLLPEELIQLADGGLVEIGSHTISHPVLSALSVAAQVDEISRSKSHLEELLGHPVNSFAYPFGGRSHYTEQTVAAVRQAGFTLACSNFAGVVHRGIDRWQLPRFLVRDWDGDEFARRLKSWLDA